MAFDSIDAIDQRGDGRTNPMVNAGAIATTSLVPGGTVDARWQFIVDGLSRLSPAIPCRSTRRSTHRRRRPTTATARSSPPCNATDESPAIRPMPWICTRASARSTVTATDLALMGSTLADGGVHPLSQVRVVEAAELPVRARRHDDGRSVRDVRRLAVRHRASRQKRHRRRHRHRRAWQRRPRHVLPAPRRGRQQRQGPTRRVSTCPTDSGSTCSGRPPRCGERLTPSS